MDQGCWVRDSQSPVIFLSGCDIDPSIEDYFGIHDGDTGRALVVPDSTTDIPIDMGETAWLNLVKALA
jgi:hypothetical protein